MNERKSYGLRLPNPSLLRLSPLFERHEGACKAQVRLIYVGRPTECILYGLSAEVVFGILASWLSAATASQVSVTKPQIAAQPSMPGPCATLLPWSINGQARI